jgi:hypothetical protein
VADSDFTIKAFDRLPSIQATLSDDLTTATSVDFIMRPATNGTPSGTVKVNSPAVIVSSGATSVVRYDWALVDTDTAGQYVAEFEVHFTGGKTRTFPTAAYLTISVLADLDGAA